MGFLLPLTLTITLMFAGGRCESESMSCSTVNGKTVCERQRSEGNVAGSSANAMFGPGGSAQDAYAMTGNSNTGQSSSSRTSAGNMPPGGFGFGPGNFPYVPPMFGAAFGSPTDTGVSDFANTGTSGPFATSTSGSVGTGGVSQYSSATTGGFGGASTGGFDGSFGGFGAFSGGFGGPSGGFVGASAGGFGGGLFPGVPNFGTGGGVTVGNMNPQNMFGPGFPFSFVFGRR